MNSTAAPAVILERSVAVPRAPNAVCDPVPPKALARSWPLPCLGEDDQDQEQAHEHVKDRDEYRHHDVLLLRSKPQMRLKESALRLAPPTRAPSMSASAMRSSTLSGFTLPP